METTLTTIRDIVAIITLPIIIYQLWILKSSFIQGHERCRNEKAVDLLRDWTKSLNPKSSAARIIVEQLDKQTCVNLEKQKKISVPNSENNENLLKAIFNEDFHTNGEKIKLDIVKSAQLRWEIVKYLNVLESILTAYRNNVANKTILKEQFKFLVNPRENHYVLEEFREAIGIDNLPGIRDFTEEIKNELNTPTPPTGITGILKFFHVKK